MTAGPARPVVSSIGVDIVLVARVARSLERFGNRFTAAVFTPAERAYCDGRPPAVRAAAYAARFAAKEAVIKALGATDATFAEIEIVRDGDGGLGTRLRGSAAAHARRRGLHRMAVSMSHEDEYAVAAAVGVGPVENPYTEGTPMAEESVRTGGCVLPLLDRQDAFARIQSIYDHEQRVGGTVRNLTKVTAHSPAVWDATTRALGLYGRLRKIDRRLVDLLCLYTSLLNGCRYCVDDAAGEALTSGWSGEELLALGGGHRDVYGADVVVALRYAAVLTHDPHAVDEQLMAALRDHFDDEAILELACVVSMKNFWNRLASGLRIPPESKCADEALMDALMTTSAVLRDRYRDGR
ncbi:4'-phosphopantetheinyl transferase superfamily protein [Dactylosporangium sp. NPDC050688]|uniref:4'-phosphopantetheinyl transferase superfamily protein n=1 Tax=Dactylosporangium sp. NPDC050688 TaxID=3157217 RepID=UPI003407C9A4